MTIKDIAEKSGYGVGTVSRVLNNHPNVSETARKRILEVAEKYHFVRNTNAPGSQTRMLALDIYKSFYGSIGTQGVGQAKAVVFFVIVALIAFLQLRATRSKEVEQ